MDYLLKIPLYGSLDLNTSTGKQTQANISIKHKIYQAYRDEQ